MSGAISQQMNEILERLRDVYHLDRNDLLEVIRIFSFCQTVIAMSKAFEDEIAILVGVKRGI